MDKLTHPPIVEAVIDLDCDLPARQDLEGLEAAARKAFCDEYPVLRTRVEQELTWVMAASAPPTQTARSSLHALLFLSQDGKQLVQVRAQGYSFNRLAPYTSLDDYLPEIERTWQLYLDLTKPLHIRVVRLRFINSIRLPLSEGKVDLDHYFKVGPRVPAGDALTLDGFLNRYVATERATGYKVNTVMTAQAPENGFLPIVFDNTVSAEEPGDPRDWPWILNRIEGLRALKNRIFETSLEDACLRLFQ